MEDTGHTFQINRGYVPVNGATLYCETAGNGEALVMIHGFSLDHRMWEEQFKEFSKHYFVICYDLRGFGKSSLPSADTYSQHEDLKSLLHHFAISKVILMGLSMGGRVAVDFTLTYPEMVSSIILVDTAVHGYAYTTNTTEEVMATARESGIEAANKVWMEGDLFKAAMKNPSSAHPLSQIISEYSGWHWLNKNPWTPISPTAIQQLHKINVPTLIIIGEEDLQDLLELAEIIHQDIRGSKKIIMNGVGHMSNMEDPQTFNMLVRDFLSAV